MLWIVPFAGGRCRPAFVTLAALLVGCGANGQPPRATAPNIVLIVVDTLRADRLGCYGNGRGLTPNIDRAAARGVLFRHAHAQSAWTMPSVVSLLTSRYPHGHGVVSYGAVIRDREITLPGVLHEHGYATGAFVANALLGGLRGKFEVFSEPGSALSRAWELGLDAIRWRRLIQRSSRPIFLYLHYMEPHPPYGETAKLRDLVGSRAAPDLPPLSRAMLLSRTVPLSSDAMAALLDTYDAEVAEADEQIGSLLDALRIEHVLDHAIVVITADHGEEFSDHGSMGHGHTLYEELIHVPLVMTLSGRTRPVAIDEPMSLIDVAPTLLELAGITVPPSFEGHSLASRITEDGIVDRLRGSVARWLGEPGTIFSELIDREGDASRTLRAVIRGAQKAVTRGDAVPTFYDLATDPGEHASAALSSHDRDRLERLLGTLPLVPGEPPSLRPIDDAQRRQLRALGYVD